MIGPYRPWHPDKSFELDCQSLKPTHIAVCAICLSCSGGNLSRRFGTVATSLAMTRRWWSYIHIVTIGKAVGHAQDPLSVTFCAHCNEALCLFNLKLPFKIVSVSEIEPHLQGLAQMTHEYVGKKAEHVNGDMVERPDYRCDLLVATSPCQDFSAAGQHRGIAPAQFLHRNETCPR